MYVSSRLIWFHFGLELFSNYLSEKKNAIRIWHESFGAGWSTFCSFNLIPGIVYASMPEDTNFICFLNRLKLPDQF